MSEDFDRPTDRAKGSPLYLYPSKVESIIDGDTWDVRIDQGFGQYSIDRVRAMDIDTRETHFVSHDSEEYQRGVIHTQFVEEWVEIAQRESDMEWPFILYSHEYDRGVYGRIIGDLYSHYQDEWLTQVLWDQFSDVERY